MSARRMPICSITGGACAAYGPCTFLAALLTGLCVALAGGCISLEPGAVKVAPETTTMVYPDAVHLEPGTVTISPNVEREAVHVDAGAVVVDVDVPTEPIGTGLQVIGDGIAQAALMVGEDLAARSDKRMEAAVEVARLEWQETRRQLAWFGLVACIIAFVGVLLFGIGELKRDLAAARRREV